MMTNETITTALKYLTAYYDTNNEFLSQEELTELRRTIDELKSAL